MKFQIKKRILTALFSLVALASCGSTTTTTKTLDAPDQFTFDFNKGSYSFAGSKNASFYSLKVYKYTGDTLESQAVASSGMIKATEDNSTYTGTMDYSFTACNYRAIIKALAPKYKSNFTELEGKSTNLAAPTVSAAFAGDDQNATIALTITANDAITESYKVTVADTSYSNASVSAGTLNITATDLGIEKIDTFSTYTLSIVNNSVTGYTTPEAVSVTCKKASGGQEGGGGGGGDFTFVYTDFSFTEWADTFTVVLGSHALLTMLATKAATPTDGSLYSYTLNTTDTGAPFVIESTMEFKADNTMTFHIGATGPISEATKTATWALSGGNTNVIWDA
jgi:hypothetical protein